ncbi:MAG: hypothetical protein OXK80_02185 [Bdellovibrionales bacterium]|nr:hypothetical protein [Bdellovibrionales bacterium]
MFKKLYIIFLIFIFLPFLSCVEGRYFSSQVDVQMCGATRRAGDQIVCVPTPIVRFKGQEDIICRRGLPEPFTTPWDEFRAQQGEETTGGESQDGERKNSIFLSVSDYWFKVFPVIRNRSAYHLVIEEINFKVKGGGADAQVTDKPFASGYCETTPFLYILNPGTSSEGEKGVCARTQHDRDRGIPDCNEGSYTTYSDFARSYVMGNLAFYLDGLPAPPEVNTNDSNFTTLRIPNYSVNWEIKGIFYTVSGEQVGSLQKRGRFRTQRSSF